MLAAALPLPGKYPGDCGDKETHHQLLPSSLQVKSLLVRFFVLQTLPNNTERLRKDFMACNSERDKAKQNEIYKLIRDGRFN